MLRRMVLLGAALAAAATPIAAFAQASPAPARTMRPGEERICRAQRVTGTRLGTARACHTAAEWAELRRQTIQTVSRIQNSRAWDSNGCAYSC